jgi:hypothetical protein
MCVCRGGEEKIKAEGTWVVGKKKKKKEKIQEKRNGKWGLRVWWEKKWGVEKKEKKNFEKEKTKLVLFICSLCLV